MQQRRRDSITTLIKCCLEACVMLDKDLLPTIGLPEIKIQEMLNHAIQHLAGENRYTCFMVGEQYS